jgi:hypothetical protein
VALKPDSWILDTVSRVQTYLSLFAHHCISFDCLLPYTVGFTFLTKADLSSFRS